MVALAIFLTPFLISFRHAILSRQVARQVAIPAAELSQAQSARYAAFRSRVHAGAPIVVAYRDVRPSVAGQQPRPDTVTTSTFATHLAMLAAAGYSTLSAEQLTNYLDGEPVPPRSIVLTFDGGFHGAWVYVDKMLRRYGFRGMALVPTARIGSRISRYLTWSELRRMHASGRWDIQSQGPDPGAIIPIAADGRSGGFYSVRAWLRDKQRRESPQEMRRRIRRTITASSAAFAQHGLPAPRFLGAVATDPVAHKEIGGLFRAVLLDGELPSSVSRRDTVSRRITRLAVRRTTTAAQLFRQLASMAAVEVTTRSPAEDRQRWLIDWNGGGKLQFEADGVAFDSSLPGRLEARYAPQATEDWTNYAVEVDVVGLPRRDAATTAGLIVLDGSPDECDVRVSRASMDLFCPVSGLVHRQALVPRSNHRLNVQVSWQRLLVTVDGSVRHRLRLAKTPRVTGGFGLSIYRAQGDVRVPWFRHLRLKRLPQSPGFSGSQGFPQAGSRMPDQSGERGTEAG
jgi:poly-beta-1,6-N-acetyl-D-glucosamine N-deacetylase